jgi:hypothetical protein
VALALLLELGAPPTARAQTLLDYVTFDGIDYIRWAEEPGRMLTPTDLGLEFATVECSFGEDSRTCPYGTDASAAFLPAGTRLYAVRGHPTSFRLAAVWRDRIFLYQAWRNQRARTGGALYALTGKVQAIDVQRGVPTPGDPGRPVRISAPEHVEALVGMVVGAAVRAPRAHAAADTRYWLTFWLTDGTTLGRPYFPETDDIMGGVVLPPAFRTLVERALGE